MTLTRILAAEDDYTHVHSERVTMISLALADELSFNPCDTATLQVSALLHDIGKVAVPGRILNKPGRLTEEEFGEIRKHPAAGARFVGRLKRLPRVIEAILYHHERYDGLGYPDGIAGEAIPLVARIISVADAFDAMISDRPYRRGLTATAAVDELMHHRGTQFDTRIVEGFGRAYRAGKILPVLNRSLSLATPLP